MPKTTAPVGSAADQLRAQEAEIQRLRTEHETPLFEQAADLLAQMAPLAEKLAALSPDFITPHVSILLSAPVEFIRQAANTVASARQPQVNFGTPNNLLTASTVTSSAPKA